MLVVEHSFWSYLNPQAPIVNEGGKGANLGEMTNAGIPVPLGFIVTAGANFDFLKQPKIINKIRQLLKHLVRMTRFIMLEVLGQDYTGTAWSKELTERIFIIKHALKNAMIPVITVFGLEFGYMLGGAVLTETVFSLPGVGRLMVEGIFQRDYPVVQGSMLMVATTFVLVNLLTDIAYAFFDPKIRYE